MPFFVGAFLKETLALTDGEYRAYVNSLMHYWIKGGALTVKELRTICGSNIDRVSKFYVMHDGLWRLHWLDEELDLAFANIKKARERAMRGVEARRRMGLLPAKQKVVSPPKLPVGKDGIL